MHFILRKKKNKTKKPQTETSSSLAQKDFKRLENKQLPIYGGLNSSV